MSRSRWNVQPTDDFSRKERNEHVISCVIHGVYPFSVYKYRQSDSIVRLILKDDDVIIMTSSIFPEEPSNSLAHKVDVVLFKLISLQGSFPRMCV